MKRYYSPQAQVGSLRGSNVELREGLPKKVAFLLDFVQIRGVGPCPNFLSTLSTFLYWVNLGMGREEETSAQFFLAHWHSKKVVKVVQIRGRGED